MHFIHWISWLCLLAMILPTFWIVWTKNRSSINSWIRFTRHPKRWLLATELDSDATKEDIQRALKAVVAESKNAEWRASCAYKQRDPTSGRWIVGLISNKKPTSLITDPSFTFTELEPTTKLRLSCPTDHPNSEIKHDLLQWTKKHAVTPSKSPVSLTAQFYQCWEWDIDSPSKNSLEASLWAKATETIFEMREIALYPTLITIIAIFLCGTGNYWLFGIGIFTVILMSGAHKFVFMYQREDITQEEHLQNY